MEWEKLLNQNRLKRDKKKALPEYVNPFFEDQDRIVFSQPFRRLHDKTQVHPLLTNDYVRSRLIHSIEVATVGQYIGTIVGDSIVKESALPNDITKETFGSVVRAACLAHDIGNPPFGHCGEDAFREYYKHPSEEVNNFINNLDCNEKEDLKNFEGNAQSFRILTQIENYKWNGGLQLTYATLATFMKYPWDLQSNPKNKPKFSFFQTEKEYAEIVAHEVGLIQIEDDKSHWCRHPLAYLVEASDDICYTTIDLEDGKEMGCISFEEYENILKRFVKDQDNDFYNNKLEDEGQRTSFLRSKAITALSGQVRDVFIDNIEDILCGKFEDDLLSRIDDKDFIEESNNIFVNRILTQTNLLDIEISSYKIIGDLLAAFVDACIKFHFGSMSALQKKLIKQMGIYAPREEFTPYKNIMRVHDYISGMTDRYALDCYRRLKGIPSTT